MHNLLLALNAKKKKRFSELLLFARRASLRLSFLSFFFPAKWLTKVCTPLKLGAYITWGLLCVCVIVIVVAEVANVCVCAESAQ